MDTQFIRTWLAESTYPAEVRTTVTVLCNEVDTLKGKLADEIEAGVRQFTWDAKCLRKLASVFGIAVPESDEAIVYAADRVLRQVARDASELFGKTEQLRSRISEMETELRVSAAHEDELVAEVEHLFGETERLKERVEELDGLAYSNGELYNKEYLKREESERECFRLKIAYENGSQCIDKLNQINEQLRVDALNSEGPRVTELEEALKDALHFIAGYGLRDEVIEKANKALGFAAKSLQGTETLEDVSASH